jgi:hypothetical protein
MWAVVDTVFVYRYSYDASVGAALSRMGATSLSFALCFIGSAQEFDGACILSRFLKNDKFCFCDRHALRLEQ